MVILEIECVKRLLVTISELMTFARFLHMALLQQSRLVRLIARSGPTPILICASIKRVRPYGFRHQLDGSPSLFGHDVANSTRMLTSRRQNRGVLQGVFLTADRKSTRLHS